MLRDVKKKEDKERVRAPVRHAGGLGARRGGAHAAAAAMLPTGRDDNLLPAAVRHARRVAHLFLKIAFFPNLLGVTQGVPRRGLSDATLVVPHAPSASAVGVPRRVAEHAAYGDAGAARDGARRGGVAHAPVLHARPLGARRGRADAAGAREARGARHRRGRDLAITNRLP